MLRVGGLIPYSQNFISDPNLIKALLKRSDISISDTVIDIGAGKGVVTNQLAVFCKEVIAVEIDNTLFKTLVDCAQKSNVTCINNDILKVNLPRVAYKVFSNIPFNYTSRIMEKLYFQGNSPISAYVIMQEEASNLYLGYPRETQKSLLLKPFFEISAYHNFKKTDFTPKPNVDAVMLYIRKLQQSYIKEECKQEYFDFVVYGTTQYKTTLKKSLSKIFTHEQFKRLSQTIRFSIEAKPLDLSFKQWVALFEYYQRGVANEKKAFVNGSYTKQKTSQAKLKKFYRTRKFGIHPPTA